MENYIVSPSPHIHKNISTQKIMLLVILALLPSAIAAGVFFGIRAINLIFICIASCVAFEYLFNIVAKKPNSTKDFSAIVTGLMLAFNLPATLPYYMAIIGCFVAIIIVKQLFGGIGQNFANPALTARIVLLLSFTSPMTTWVKPFYYLSNFQDHEDIIAGATTIVADSSELPNYFDMLIGNRPGCLGETSVIALLIGGIFLIIMKVISPTIPTVMLGTYAVLSVIAGEDVIIQLSSGGMLLGAFFMATDYSTTPITKKGKIIFAIGVSLITFAIRSFGHLPEGISYSILLMNILTPYIDKITRPKPFGTEKEGNNVKN